MSISKLIRRIFPPTRTTMEPGQVAYESRFRGSTPRSTTPWSELPPEARAIWARVEDDVLEALT